MIGDTISESKFSTDGSFEVPFSSRPSASVGIWQENQQFPPSLAMSMAVTAGSRWLCPTVPPIDRVSVAAAPVSCYSLSFFLLCLKEVRFNKINFLLSRQSL